MDVEKAVACGADTAPWRGEALSVGKTSRAIPLVAVAIQQEIIRLDDRRNLLPMRLFELGCASSLDLRIHLIPRGALPGRGTSPSVTMQKALEEEPAVSVPS
jgi:hypothetical protein